MPEPTWEVADCFWDALCNHRQHWTDVCQMTVSLLMCFPSASLKTLSWIDDCYMTERKWPGIKSSPLFGEACRSAVFTLLRTVLFFFQQKTWVHQESLEASQIQPGKPVTRLKRYVIFGICICICMYVFVFIVFRGTCKNGSRDTGGICTD